jgi:hypothetical protein
LYIYNYKVEAKVYKLLINVYNRYNNLELEYRKPSNYAPFAIICDAS